MVARTTFDDEASAPLDAVAFLALRRRATERYEPLLAMSPVAIMIITLSDGRFVEANESFLRMAGFLHEEIIGHTAKELGLWVSDREHIELIAAIDAEPPIRTLELELNSRSGDVRRAIAWTELVEITGTSCLLIQLFDVTDRANLVSSSWAATGQAELFQAVIESTAEGIVVYDENGIVRIANLSAQRIFGLSFEQMVGRSVFRPDYRLIREDGVEIAPGDGPVAHTLRTGVPLNDVVLASYVDSRPPIWISVTTRAVRLKNGMPPSGVVASFFDVTARVRAAAVLAARQQELLQSRDEFVATVSHELRTPLTSIVGYVDLLLEHEDRSNADRRALETVQSDAQRMATIIDDLLEVSRLELGAIEMEKTRLELDSLIRALGTSFAPLFAAKDQSFELELEPGITIYGDASRISQIVTNLLSNAHKYTPAGGKISVSARSNGHIARVNVADTGDGLTVTEQQRIFDKFYRAGSRQGSGTGLGLSITRALVELHAGTITVTSEPGRGSTFSVMLPFGV
jgi:PAS domain S-box-containing protein